MAKINFINILCDFCLITLFLNPDVSKHYKSTGDRHEKNYNIHYAFIWFDGV